MKRWVGCGVLALALVACKAPPQRPAAPPAPNSVTELAEAIAADSRRSDREPDGGIRAQLAADASRDADACIAREPQAVACLYGRALALGLEARSHPTRAGEFLSGMLAALTSAEAADPNYDDAGPARVRALVLIRAPGWPLGPGDPDAGLAAARRAATLRPQYPPNLLALAEALTKMGDSTGARNSYERARTAAQAFPPASDRDEWVRQAEQGLQRK